MGETHNSASIQTTFLRQISQPVWFGEDSWGRRVLGLQQVCFLGGGRCVGGPGRKIIVSLCGNFQEDYSTGQDRRTGESLLIGVSGCKISGTESVQSRRQEPAWTAPTEPLTRAARRSLRSRSTSSSVSIVCTHWTWLPGSCLVFMGFYMTPQVSHVWIDCDWRSSPSKQWQMCFKKSVFGKYSSMK